MIQAAYFALKAHAFYFSLTCGACGDGGDDDGGGGTTTSGGSFGGDVASLLCVVCDQIPIARFLGRFRNRKLAKVDRSACLLTKDIRKIEKMVAINFSLKKVFNRDGITVYDPFNCHFHQKHRTFILLHIALVT